MSYKIIQKMPTVERIIARHPLSQKGEAQVLQDRKEVGAILSGEDKRLLFIAGPCSAWPSEAVLTFAERLKKLSDEVKDSIKIVMRVYIQKPRTIRGWLGPVNQPDPFESPDIAKGAEYCRDMMVKIIEMGLPIADEALFTHNAKGFAELLSWMAIGARSVEDQEHRIFASAADCPVGMKNATSGSIEIAVNGIVAAQHPHHTTFDGNQIETTGNPFAHLVLRGGFRGSNYDPAHVHKAGALFEKHKVKNPAIIIDASHDNCKVDGVKVSGRQSEVVRESLAFMQADAEYRRLVKGFMIESFLKEGSQKLESTTPETIDRGGLSITDPCLGWESTENIIREVAAARGL
ncbi:3-deoxy-7-phosphoheptulonate synthase [Candidatus Kaiserbacteria bacterium RIFCSPHIGHO2_01_FULL_53_29]|uniref:Phospho-2-dehydro-3-deoxyheptonate aldolase n=1 Tax=Candidatus Kaiserbacteria bacterium RIFCSPHIGHO2_01_FULL_53_29 TaxID=1798480 RepID=A0A1F6CVA5_9BACT|nr:MAG: 3-deoxy-7-phosphoheptulonate synthase [Candidatus Kaiserbacteria bacterium RIFCSPHIGHO2_01_FULL_53_29]